MDFINNMRDRLSQASQLTVQKAKDLSELAKLNSAISNAEKQINELYGKIGYKIYCTYYDSPLPEVSDLISQVTKLHQSIETCKMQIKAINSANSCPQCGAKISKDMAFCSGCGYKLISTEQPANTEPTLFCSNCGAPISSGSIFCTSCGQKIG